ncbi:hypothetical protein Syun_011819 [Stephania yunnanensis]|uniref:magnesium chelatase n=1 Tax=Stephania yunnanensis TaxID=152371 RepID=A0AAP0PGW3_9MAGN
MEHKKNMRIIEKIKEIEAEMARTQKNKATGYTALTDSSNYRSAKVPLETFVRIPSTCFDLTSEIFIYFYRKVVIAFSANWILAFVILVLLPLVGLNGYIQLKFMKGFRAEAKVKDRCVDHGYLTGETVGNCGKTTKIEELHQEEPDLANSRETNHLMEVLGDILKQDGGSDPGWNRGSLRFGYDLEFLISFDSVIYAFFYPDFSLQMGCHYTLVRLQDGYKEKVYPENKEIAFNVTMKHLGEATKHSKLISDAEKDQYQSSLSAAVRELDSKNSGSLIFVEELAQKIKSAVEKERDRLDASSAGFADSMLKLVRTLPKVLKYLPSDKAQDARLYILSLQFWLGGSPENLQNFLKMISDFGIASIFVQTLHY